MCKAKAPKMTREQKELQAAQLANIEAQNAAMEEQAATARAQAESSRNQRKTQRQKALFAEERKRSSARTSSAGFFTGSSPTNTSGAAGSLLRRGSPQ